MHSILWTTRLTRKINIIKNIDIMKRFIIFTVSLLIIGWLDGQCQVMVNKIENGFRISSPKQAVDLSETEYEVFAVFVQNVIDKQSGDYFDTQRIDVGKDAYVEKANGRRYIIRLAYNTNFGFIIDDGEFIEMEPVDIMDAMIRYMEERALETPKDE